MEQIKKIAKNLNRYFGVIKFINIVVTIISIIACIYILFMSDSNQLSNIISIFTIDWLSIEFSESLFTNPISAKIYLIIQLVVIYLHILVFLKLLNNIRNILNVMIEETVFKDSMAESIMELSFICFIYGVLQNISGFINYRFLIDYSNLIPLLKTGKIIDVSLSYTFNFNFIVLSAIIYLLSYIFRHGAQLQQLSDETL